MRFHSLHTYQLLLAPPPAPAAGRGEMPERKGERVAEEERGIALFWFLLPRLYLPPTSLWLIPLFKKKAPTHIYNEQAVSTDN